MSSPDTVSTILKRQRSSQTPTVGGDSRRQPRETQLALEEEEFSLALSAPRARGYVSFAADGACEPLVERLLSHSEKNPASQVVVYGGTLDALACVRGLLDAGVAPAKIALVFPSEQLEQKYAASLDSFVGINSTRLSPVFMGYVREIRRHSSVQRLSLSRVCMSSGEPYGETCGTLEYPNLSGNEIL